MSGKSSKLSLGPKGGIPPFKEGQKIDLKIIHWCLWGPRVSGMYETVRELIQAENQIEGVLAGMCETPNSKAPVPTVQKAAMGGKADTLFPMLRTQDWGYGMKWADIHMIHSTMSKKIGELKPKAFFHHGVPEACLANDLEKGSVSFMSAAEWTNKMDATFVTSKRAHEIWGAFDWGKKIHLVTKGIDLDWWTRSTTQQDLEGEPSILYGEIWRGIKHPLHLFYACKRLFEENPKMRLNVWGLNTHQKFWERFAQWSSCKDFIGKRGLKGIIDYPSHYYTRGDVLMSPGLYGDVSRTQQEAMACFPAGTRVETMNGSKPIEAIQIGDLVLTHKGRFMPVTNLYKRNYEGLLWSVDADHSFKATPNHPILVNNEWINAGEIETCLDGGLSLYGWSPRWRRILSVVDEAPASEIETSRIRYACATLRRGRTELSTPSDIRLSPLTIWGSRARPSFPTREEMDTQIQATCGPIPRGSRAMDKGKNGLGGHYSSRMQKNNIQGQRGEQLQDVGMVFETSRINELHKLRSHASEAEQSVNAFRPAPITNIREIWHDAYVYNIGVGNDNSYVAEGFVVHNCGCPVVSWDTDPYGDAHSYRYAKAFDTQNLADKLMEVYNEVLDDRETVAQRCRNLATKYFNIHDEAQQIVDVLRQVVEET